MQRQSSFKFSRCFSNIPRMIFPLVFITLLTITIISSKTSYPYIHFTSTTTTRISRDQIALPYSLHNQIYHLQTQLGVLLKELRTENPGSKSLTKFTDQVLAVAVSLDRLADNLAHLYANPPIAQNETSRVEEDLTQSEDDEDEEQLLNERRIFSSRELHNYTSPRPNRQGGKKNFLGVEAVYPSIGLSCAGAATNIDRFMTYKLYGTCPDDWAVAQKLMVSGCDPVPRRKCFSRSPPRYSKPLPINSSLWTLPADESSSAEFMVDQVLGLKPGEIRIGLDFSPTTGTFAAIMRERNITIASATLNLGAPFSEVIALRGLLPLYISIGSRLPFFDNTLDIIHSTLFLDGWIGLEVLQYVLFDWDRVLRPKGILWVDRFFCSKEDMKLYLEEFSKLSYKKLLWRVVPKTDKAGDELFFSAVLEKPLRV